MSLFSLTMVTSTPVTSRSSASICCDSTFFIYKMRSLVAAASAKSLKSCPTLRPHRQQPARLPRPWDSPGKNTGVGCHFLLQCRKVKSESEVAQSCPTFSDPMDCSPPGSFSSVAQSCPALCNPMNCSTPGLPVHHQLPEFTQIHVHRVSDAIQPSHPLSSPSPPAPNPSQHQSLFQ